MSERWHTDFLEHEVALGAIEGINYADMWRELSLVYPETFPVGTKPTGRDCLRCAVAYNLLKQAHTHQLQPVKEATFYMLEYLWRTTGSPRWFIDAPMAELLRDTSIDTNINNIRMPYDSFGLVFEKGVEAVPGIPLRWVRILSARSALAQGLLQKSFGIDTNTSKLLPEYIFFQVDFGLKCKYENVVRPDGSFMTRVAVPSDTFVFDEDISPDATTLVQGLRHIDDIAKPTKWQMEPEDKGYSEAINKAVHAAVAAILYWNARSEFVKDYTLPRSCRYQFKEREHIKRVYLPIDKVVRPRAEVVGTGSAKAPHFRGFVLRTLRSERYARNDDGTFKVILVPPCAIHPELMEVK